MFEDINLLLKQTTGCGIFLFETDEELEEALKYIESNTEENNYLFITSEEIGVLDVDDFLKQKLKEKGFGSLKEFAESQLKNRRKGIIVVKNIEHLSFEQLKSFENICKEARSSFSLFLLGKTKVQSLIDSFYLKDLRKNAIVLHNCGNVKKEEVREFAEKYFRTTLGRDISVEPGVENVLYKLSEGNEKKLEQVLTKLAGYIRDNLLSKDIIGTYLKDKGIEFTEEKKETKEDTEKRNINIKTIAFASLAVVIIGAILFIISGNKENPKEIAKNHQNQQKTEEKESNPVSPVNTSTENKETSIDEKTTTTVAEETQNLNQSNLADNDQKNIEEKIIKEKYYFPLKKVVYLREEANDKAKIVAKATNRKLLKAVEENKDWIKVQIKKGDKVIEGWVKRNQVTVVPEGKGVIFARALNLREHPSLTAKIVKSIPYGTVVDIQSKLNVENRTWYKVNYIDQNGDMYQGWVSGKYVLYNEKKDS